MLLAQHLLSIFIFVFVFIFIFVFVLIVALRVFAFLRTGAVRNGALPDALASNEDLCLQQVLAFAGFALHVVGRVFVANVGVEAKDHAVQALPGPVDILSKQVPPD